MAEPAERADANARTCLKPRSARSASVTRPTAPVAPTTPIRISVMRPCRFGAVQLECGMQCPDRLLDLVARHEAADLDRRCRHELRLDAELLEGRKRLRGDA